MDALSGIAIAAASTPGALGFAGSRLARLDARASRRASVTGALVALVSAIVVGGLYASSGSSSGSLLWLDFGGGLRLSLGARVDGLTVAMLLTVTLIAAVVTRYAERYLDGDPAQARFCQWLSYTTSAVLVVIIASNLAVLLAGWVATSHGLHRLLTHWSDRPAAILAARKKFLISRLGDVMLVLALVLLARRFGSLEFEQIFAQAAALPATDDSLLPVASLLVLGAMTKSAQFPFHTWLPDSMETPTPVSALMHAGIINAGGFLLIRMSPVLAAAPLALVPLAAGGAFTALLGSIGMLTQTDAKRKYAYSTVSQMGFMMLQCGLGAFAPAALHMVGHAFYKGHAFLAASSLVDPEPRRSPPPVAGRAGLAGTVLALAAGIGLVAAAAIAMGVEPSRKPGLPVLGAILAIAVAQGLLVTGAVGRRSLRSRATALAAGVAIAVLYFTGVAAVEALLGPAIPGASLEPSPAASWVALAVLVAFGLAFLIQQRLPVTAGRPFLQAAYVHVHNGFYLGALEDRLVEGLWPLSRRAARPEEKGAERCA